MGASLGPSPDDHARALGHPTAEERHAASVGRWPGNVPAPWWWSRPHGHLPTGGAPYPTWDGDPDRCLRPRCSPGQPAPDRTMRMLGVVLVGIAAGLVVAMAIGVVILWRG